VKFILQSKGNTYLIATTQVVGFPDFIGKPWNFEPE